MTFSSSSICTSSLILLIFFDFPFELDKLNGLHDRAPFDVTQVDEWFNAEQYQIFPFPNLFCPSLLQPQIIFSELYIHLEELVQLLFQDIRGAFFFSDRILSLSC